MKSVSSPSRALVLAAIIATAMSGCTSIEEDASSTPDAGTSMPDSGTEPPKPDAPAEPPKSGCELIPCDTGYNCNASKVCEPISVANGKIMCVDSTEGALNVTFTGDFSMHLKKPDGSGQDADGTVTLGPTFRLRWGSAESGWGILDPYDAGKDQELWSVNAGTYSLTLPGITATWNGAWYDTATHQTYWTDLDEVDVSGSCSHVLGAGGVTHTPSGTPPTSNATMTCANTSDGQNVDVTISGNMSLHLKKSDGSGQDADGIVTLNSNFKIRWGSDQSGWNIATGYTKTETNWVDSTTPRTVRLPMGTLLFNEAFFDSTTNLVYWVDLDEVDVSGSCSHVLGAGGVTHTPSGTPPTSNGTISCSFNGPDMTLTVSSGVTPHLVGNPTVSPTSSWRMQFGSTQTSYNLPYTTGKPSLTWNGDGATYPFIIAVSDTAIRPALTDGSNVYVLDLSEYTFFGGCYAVNGYIYH